MRSKLILLFCIFAWAAQSQTYSISPAKTVTVTAPYSNITIFDIFQKNTGSSPIILQWERVSVNLPAGWGYSMCDYATCYSGIPAGPSTMDTIYPGNDGFLGLNIDPDVISGSGVVKAFVYQQGFKSNGDTLTWYVNTSSVGIEELFDSKGIMVYPNPASDVLYLDLNTAEVSSASLTDGSGRVVLEIPLQNSNRINLSNLSKGFYILNLETGSGRLSKRIVKN